MNIPRDDGAKRRLSAPAASVHRHLCGPNTFAWQAASCSGDRVETLHLGNSRSDHPDHGDPRSALAQRQPTRVRLYCDACHRA